MASPTYRYEIDPQPAQLGGRWRLLLMEDDQEVSAGVFPRVEYADDPEPEKTAFAEAQTEGESWVATR